MSGICFETIQSVKLKLFVLNVCVCVCVCVFYGLYHMACGILVPQPGIKPGPLAVKVQSPNHWTVR